MTTPAPDEETHIPPSLLAEGGTAVLATRSNAAVTSFFNLDSVTQGLARSGWTPTEEIERLAQYARGAEPADAMRAMRQIREIVREHAQLNGLIASQTAVQSRPVGDSEVSVSTSSTRLIQSMKESQSNVEPPQVPAYASVHLRAIQRQLPAPDEPIVNSA